jgi:hypothetical protein
MWNKIGRPIFPLFIICAEVLSSQLCHAEVTGLLKEVPTSLRAQDSLIYFLQMTTCYFTRLIPKDWGNLSTILERYERASKQRLNRDKTSIFFSRNTNHDNKLGVDPQIIKCPSYVAL